MEAERAAQRARTALRGAGFMARPADASDVAGAQDVSGRRVRAYQPPNGEVLDSHFPVMSGTGRNVRR